jgi:hypothetical protein
VITIAAATLIMLRRRTDPNYTTGSGVVVVEALGARRPGPLRRVTRVTRAIAPSANLTVVEAVASEWLHQLVLFVRKM